MRENKEKKNPTFSTDKAILYLSQLKPNMVLIETGNALGAGLNPEPEPELTPAGFWVKAPAPRPTCCDSGPGPTSRPLTLSLPCGLTTLGCDHRIQRQKQPQESERRGTEKVTSSQKACSTGAEHFLEKTHHMGNLESRGGLSEGCLTPGEWPPGGSLLPAPCRRPRLPPYFQDEKRDPNGLPVQRGSVLLG